MARLGKLMLRENRDFHVIQEIEAALRQYSLPRSRHLHFRLKHATKIAL
ncbi:hypothetical protein [Nostoc sp.]